MSQSKFYLSKALLYALGALGITLLFRIIFNEFPELAENLYYKGVYYSFRRVWDSFFGKSPIPLFYIWLILLGILFSIFLRNAFSGKTSKIQNLKRLALVLIIHFIWFYWTWGFNYSRITLGQRWAINTPIQDELFLNEFLNQTLLVDSIRQLYKNEIDNYQIEPLQLENKIRNSVTTFQRQYGFMEFNHVRCRNLSFQGILLIWSTSGVYLPFVGESQFDGGLHKLSKPFTMAHELCHGMGWTHEGDCNFIAYLICSKSQDPLIRYSGELNYWRYLYANASRTHPEQFKLVKSTLTAEVLNDLKEINEANDRYPEIFPTWRTWFYDWYLKKNGIASGDKSYSEIIRMVINYKKLKMKNEK